MWVLSVLPGMWYGIEGLILSKFISRSPICITSPEFRIASAAVGGSNLDAVRTMLYKCSSHHRAGVPDPDPGTGPGFDALAAAEQDRLCIGLQPSYLVHDEVWINIDWTAESYERAKEPVGRSRLSIKAALLDRRSRGQ